MNGQPAATLNTAAALRPFNGFASLEAAEGQPGSGVNVGGSLGNEGGVINLGLNAAARGNLDDVATAPQWLLIELEYKFTGTSLANNVVPDAEDRIGFGINNNAFDLTQNPAFNTAVTAIANARAAAAIPAAPAVVQAYTAAAVAVNSNAEFTVATARITPRSNATRVRVEGLFDAFIDTARNNDQNARILLRLYRGANLIEERRQGDDHVPRDDDFHYSAHGLVIDAPASAAEQTYTMRAIREGMDRDWSITRRRLILTEVL